MRSHQLPKISGVLNNCALHACVPELLTAISYFATQEAEETWVAGSNPYHLPEYFNANKLVQFKPHYEKLKNNFARFYAINPQDLTWEKLEYLLTTSVENNKAAAQLMMGLVLREFMEENKKAMQSTGSPKVIFGSENVSGVLSVLSFYKDTTAGFFSSVNRDMPYCNFRMKQADSMTRFMVQYSERTLLSRVSLTSSDSDLLDTSTLQNDGRYETLDAKPVAKYVCFQLGIQLKAHTKMHANNPEHQVMKLLCDDPAFFIKIYNENYGHWERHGAKGATLDDDIVNMSGIENCKMIDAAIDRITSNNTIRDTKEGLRVLKQAVRENFAKIPAQLAKPKKVSMAEVD